MAQPTYTRPSIRIGKLSSKGTKYPWEPGYVAAMKQTTGQLVDIITKMLDDLVAISPDIMMVALEPTFEKSQEYCPKDTGALVASGYLEVTDYRSKPRVEMGYARGGNPFYAVIVHENMELHHEPPTRAKWLQAAMLEDIGEIAYRLANNYSSALGLGGEF